LHIIGLIRKREDWSDRFIGKKEVKFKLFQKGSKGEKSMSVERWDDDRLDRLANTVERIGDRVDGLAIRLDTMADRIDTMADHMTAFDIRMDALGAKLEVTANIAESNARVVQALANVAAEAREERQQLFERMAEQQEEIRGLQTENRRMLDILLNQRNQDDNPTT
jgi:chromosome segregation ATPase